MALICAISLLAVTGWLFNHPVLASLRSDYIPMAPATAVLFLGLCGAWLIHRVFPDRRGMRILVQAGLVGMLIIVILLALRTFAGLGPDLEKLLYPAPPSFGQVSSARMSPLSDLGFLLAIPAFLLLTGGKPGQRIKSASNALSVVLFLLSGLICLGYLYGTPPFYGGTVIPVAITTALSFWLLSLGLLMTARPDTWPVRMYTGHSIKARLMRILIPASLLIVLLQGLLSTAVDPWGINPAIEVGVAAIVACLIVMIIISLIANNFSAEIERGSQAQTLQEAVYRIAAAAETTKSLDELYPQIHQIILSVMPAEYFYITLYDETQNLLRFPYFKDAEDEPFVGGIQPGKGLTAYVLRTGKSLLCTQAVHDELERQGEVKLLGVPSAIWLGVPLIVEGKTIGAMVVQHYSDQKAYGEREQHMLEFVSTQVAIAINRKRAEEALRQSEAELRALFASMRDEVLVIDRHGVYLKIAPTNPELLVKPSEELLGKTLQDVFPPEQVETFLKTLQQVLDTKQTMQIEYDLTIGDRTVRFATSISPMTEDSTLWVAHDITERKRMEEEIRTLSMNDELTGLYNRRGFTLLAEHEVKLAHRLKRTMMLFFGDVDDLKSINDTHGHAQGDLALMEVSNILKETFREADIVARFGGDEFVVLAVDASLESAETMTNRIQDTLERRNQQGDRPYQLTLSMGFARCDPELACTVSELIAQADNLMYAQKHARKGKK